MDAGVGVEADLKLQRKAADLIQELQRSLRKCLWSTADARSQRRVRPALKVKDLEKLIQLVIFMMLFDALSIIMLTMLWFGSS